MCRSGRGWRSAATVCNSSSPMSFAVPMWPALWMLACAIVPLNGFEYLTKTAPVHAGGAASMCMLACSTSSACLATHGVSLCPKQPAKLHRLTWFALTCSGPSGAGPQSAGRVQGKRGQPGQGAHQVASHLGGHPGSQTARDRGHCNPCGAHLQVWYLTGGASGLRPCHVGHHLPAGNSVLGAASLLSTA